MVFRTFFILRDRSVKTLYLAVFATLACLWQGTGLASARQPSAHQFLVAQADEDLMGDLEASLEDETPAAENASGDEAQTAEETETATEEETPAPQEDEEVEEESAGEPENQDPQSAEPAAPAAENSMPDTNADPAAAIPNNTNADEAASLEDELEGLTGEDQPTNDESPQESGADEDSLQKSLEQDEIEAIEAPSMGQENPEESDQARSMEPGKVESLKDVTEGTVFKQQKVLDTAIKRLKFSRSDMENGILIKRTDRGVASSAAYDGFTGLFRTISSEMNDRNSFRFGSHISFYHSPLLWDNVSQSHLDAVGFFTYSVLPMLELRIAANASGHSSGESGRYKSDPLFQILGDIQLGGKYVYSVLPYLNISGLLDLKFYTNIEKFGVRFDTFSSLIMAGGSFDFRDQPWFDMPFPLRGHLNVGYFIDNSVHLLPDVDELTASSFFGLGVSPGDKLYLRLGFDVPWDPWQFFLEYSTDQYFNVPEDAGISVNKWSQSPQRITPGIRYNPVENIMLDFAFDMSFGMQSLVKVFNDLQPSSNPYALNFGVSYEWNPKGWGVYDLRGQIQGIIVDADSGEPVGGAIIEYVDSPAHSAQVAYDETGEFLSYRLPPGVLKIRVYKEEYEPRIIETEVVSKEAIEEKFFLRKKGGLTEALGIIMGEIVDRDGNAVVADVSFGDGSIDPVVSSSEDGSFVKMVPPGLYIVSIRAEGYEEKNYEVPVDPEKKTRLDVQLISGEQVGAFGGTVVDQDGRPLSARIEFLDAQIEPMDADAFGGFFRVLPPGLYKVSVVLGGYSRRLLEIPIETDQKTTVDITLEAEHKEGAFEGTVLSSTNKPLAAIIVFDDTSIPPIPADPETGTFLKLLPPGNYGITIQSPGYGSKQYEVPIIDGKKTVKDFILENVLRRKEGLAHIEGNRIVTTRPLGFEPGSDLMNNISFEILADVAKLVLQDSVRALRIEVHTNNLGPGAANMALSEKRAQVIVQYLQTLGVPIAKLRPSGMGEEQPIAPNDNAEGRAQNERVELYIE